MFSSDYSEGSCSDVEKDERSLLVKKKLATDLRNSRWSSIRVMYITMFLSSMGESLALVHMIMLIG